MKQKNHLSVGIPTLPICTQWCGVWKLGQESHVLTTNLTSSTMAILSLLQHPHLSYDGQHQDDQGEAEGPAQRGGHLHSVSIRCLQYS